MLKTLSSMKTGLVLMALITVLSILATLWPGGSIIYASFPFRTLLVILTVNLIACTMSRLPLLFKAKGTYLKKLGAHLIHISILSILLGSLVGSIYGGEEYIEVYLEEKKPLVEEVFQGLYLHLQDFQTLYDSNNHLDNWQSSFLLFQGDQLVTTASTKVNLPYNYQGIKFYQTGYGYDHLVEVAMGGEIRRLAFPHNQVIPLMDRAFMVFTDYDQEFYLKVYQNNHLQESFNLTAGQDLELFNGLKLTYLSLDPYSVIMAKKDPGLPLVFLGFMLMSVGFTLSWLSNSKTTSRKE